MKVEAFFINLFTVLIHFVLSETEMSWIDEEEEQEALAELRTVTDKLLTEEFMKEDAYLLRWLKASNFDIEKTLEKLQVALDWRKQNNVSTILFEEFTPRMVNDYPVRVDGTTDKFDRPIMHIGLGGFNLRRVTIAGHQDQLTRFTIQKLEMAEKLIYYTKRVEKPGSQVSNAILILDIQGFNLMSVGCWNCMGIVSAMVPIMDTYYAGLFYKIYIVNAPGIFNTMLGIIKSFMSAATQSTIELYDNNRLLWSEVLLKQIAPDQLPEKFGGYVPSRAKNTLKTKLLGYMEAEMDEKAKKGRGEVQDAKHHDNPEVESINVLKEVPVTSAHGNHEHHHHFTEAEAEETVPEQVEVQGNREHGPDDHKHFMKIEHENSSQEAGHNFSETNDVKETEITNKLSNRIDSGLVNNPEPRNPKHLKGISVHPIVKNSGTTSLTKHLSSTLMSLGAIATRFFYLGN